MMPELQDTLNDKPIARLGDQQKPVVELYYKRPGSSAAPPNTGFRWGAASIAGSTGDIKTICAKRQTTLDERVDSENQIFLEAPAEAQLTQTIRFQPEELKKSTLGNLEDVSGPLVRFQACSNQLATSNSWESISTSLRNSPPNESYPNNDSQSASSVVNLMRSRGPSVVKDGCKMQQAREVARDDIQTKEFQGSDRLKHHAHQVDQHLMDLHASRSGIRPPSCDENTIKKQRQACFEDLNQLYEATHRRPHISEQKTDLKAGRSIEAFHNTKTPASIDREARHSTSRLFEILGKKLASDQLQTKNLISTKSNTIDKLERQTRQLEVSLDATTSEKRALAERLHDVEKNFHHIHAKTHKFSIFVNGLGTDLEQLRNQHSSLKSDQETEMKTYCEELRVERDRAAKEFETGLENVRRLRTSIRALSKEASLQLEASDHRIRHLEAQLSEKSGLLAEERNKSSRLEQKITEVTSTFSQITTKMTELHNASSDKMSNIENLIKSSSKGTSLDDQSTELIELLQTAKGLTADSHSVVVSLSRHAEQSRHSPSLQLQSIADMGTEFVTKDQAFKVELLNTLAGFKEELASIDLITKQIGVLSNSVERLQEERHASLLTLKHLEQKSDLQSSEITRMSETIGKLITANEKLPVKNCEALAQAAEVCLFDDNKVRSQDMQGLERELAGQKALMKGLYDACEKVISQLQASKNEHSNRCMEDMQLGHEPNEVVELMKVMSSEFHYRLNKLEHDVSDGNNMLRDEIVATRTGLMPMEHSERDIKDIGVRPDMEASVIETRSVRSQQSMSNEWPSDTDNQTRLHYRSKNSTLHGRLKENGSESQYETSLGIDKDHNKRMPLDSNHTSPLPATKLLDGVLTKDKLTLALNKAWSLQEMTPYLQTLHSHSPLGSKYLAYPDALASSSPLSILLESPQTPKSKKTGGPLKDISKRAYGEKQDSEGKTDVTNRAQQATSETRPQTGSNVCNKVSHITEEKAKEDAATRPSTTPIRPKRKSTIDSATEHVRSQKKAKHGPRTWAEQQPNSQLSSDVITENSDSPSCLNSSSRSHKSATTVTSGVTNLSHTGARSSGHIAKMTALKPASSGSKRAKPYQQNQRAKYKEAFDETLNKR